MMDETAQVPDLLGNLARAVAGAGGEQSRKYLEQDESAEVGIAVLHGFDPTTEKVTTDVFREGDDVHDEGPTSPSPWHRARALRDVVADDFPGWVWSIGQNERSRDLMAAENMRRWLGAERDLDDRTCSTPDCPGDGRYVPPGKGHLSDCRHLSTFPTTPTAGGDGRG